MIVATKRDIHNQRDIFCRFSDRPRVTCEIFYL